MIKTGDKVICINNNGLENKLSLNDYYTASNINNNSITLFEKNSCLFLLRRFISLIELRKLKINRLNIHV